MIPTSSFVLFLGMGGSWRKVTSLYLFHLFILVLYNLLLLTFTYSDQTLVIPNIQIHSNSPFRHLRLVQLYPIPLSFLFSGTVLLRTSYYICLFSRSLWRHDSRFLFPFFPVPLSFTPSCRSGSIRGRKWGIVDLSVASHNWPRHTNGIRVNENVYWRTPRRDYPTSPLLPYSSVHRKHYWVCSPGARNDLPTTLQLPMTISRTDLFCSSRGSENRRWRPSHLNSSGLHPLTTPSAYPSFLVSSGQCLDDEQGG